MLVYVLYKFLICGAKMSSRLILKALVYPVMVVYGVLLFVISQLTDRWVTTVIGIMLMCLPLVINLAKDIWRGCRNNKCKRVDCEGKSE